MLYFITGICHYLVIWSTFDGYLVLFPVWRLTNKATLNFLEWDC